VTQLFNKAFPAFKQGITSEEFRNIFASLVSHHAGPSPPGGTIDTDPEGGWLWYKDDTDEWFYYRAPTASWVAWTIGGGGGESVLGPMRLAHFGAFPQSTVRDLYDAEGAYSGVEMPSLGSVIAVVLKTTNPRTAGSLSARLTKNGSPLAAGGLDVALNATNPTRAAAIVLPNTAPYTFVAWDTIGVRLTSDGVWLPNTGLEKLITFDFFASLT